MKVHRLGLIRLSLAALALQLAALQTGIAQTFTTDSPLLVARWSHTATLLNNGLVLIAGGETFNDSTNGQLRGTNSAELYDPVTHSSKLTTPMDDSQFSDAAVLLTNGQVLVIGGRDDRGNILGLAELYDPVAATWTDTFMETSRSSFPAVLLTNGQVLVAGGFNGSELSSVEIFDPNTEEWTNAASMNYASDSMSATVLTNGMVLVAGGSDGSGGALTNSILYDPANNTWTNTGPLNLARAAHAATLLPNGKVLVVGGAFFDNRAEVYDPNTGTWSFVASMNDSHFFPTANLLPNGQVLVVAGFIEETNTEIYDPVGDTWTESAPLNVGRLFHTATLVAGGQVVVTGGSAGTAGGGEFNGPALTDVETFGQINLTPPPTGTWSLTGPASANLFFPTLTTLTNGMVLEAGGQIQGFPPVSTSAATLYNPASGTWTNTGRLNTDRYNHTATLLENGKVLAAGGLSGVLGSAVRLVSAELYDPVTQTWTNTGSMHSARILHAAVTLTDGHVLAAGGNEDRSSEIYSPATQTWADTGFMNSVRFNFNAVRLLNGQVMAYGGTGDNTMEIYDPIAREWTTNASPLIEVESATMTLLPNGDVLLAGGNDTNNDTVATAELYHPATQSWTQIHDMNIARSGATAIQLTNGVVLVAGGLDTNGDSIGDSELYDPSAGTWTITGSMQTAVDLPQSVLLPSGQVLAIGADTTVAQIYTTTAAGFLLINPITLAGGAFQFSFNNTPGAGSTVFATTDVTQPFGSWLNLGSATEVSAGQFQFTDTNAANFSGRFYHVSSP